MEAVPRLPMLSCELKTSPTNAEFASPLKKYIAEFYHENPENYNKEIKEIESLRMSACKVPCDFTGIRVLKRYYAQLLCIQSRFPMAEEGEATVTFVWSDIYSGTVFNITDIRYEEACILYNIGALHSELGANDKRTNAEGMKVACTHFQCAAWAFQHLRDNYPQPKGSDMSQDLLSCFVTLMLAQAQECILEKSMLDSRKSTITAKVAAQVVEFYKSTLNVLLLGSATVEPGCILDIVKTKMFKHLEKFLEFKITYYTSIAHLYMGNQAEEQQLMGERVAWYQSALEKHEEAVKLTKHLNKEEIMDALTFTLDVIGGKCNAAKKENEFVYHEKVLPPAALPEIKGASLVKGVPFSPQDPEVCGPDIFARLVPMETHEASSLYSEEKAKLLREISARIAQKNEELAKFRSSIQLDRHSLIPKMENIPEELVERCAALSVKPNAINDMKSSLNELMDICEEVDMLIKDAKNLLLKDEEREKQHQEMFGKRPPQMITVELSKELSKYEMAHKKAIESNASLQKALEIHLADIQILQSPLPELQKKIPSISISDIPNGEEVVRELEALFDKVDEMQSQREMLEIQLREAVHNDDITKLLVTRDRKDSLQKIFGDQLKKHEPLLGYLDQNLSAQENIFRALINTISRYAEARKMFSKTMADREILIENLMKSYDAYDDLVLKAQKGIDFYNKLQTNVQRLQARVKSVTSVQEEERSQISQSQTKRISKQPSIPGQNSSSVQPSATPKLKDYLPFMTGRISGAVVAPNISSQPPSSWVATSDTGSSIYPIPSNPPLNNAMQDPSSYTPSNVTETVPMGVRPAPVGSEQTNTGYNKYADAAVKNQNYYSQYGYQSDSTYTSQNTPSSYSYNYSPTITSATTLPPSNYYQTPNSQYYTPTTTNTTAINYGSVNSPEVKVYGSQNYPSDPSSLETSSSYPYQYSTSYTSTNQYNLPTSVTQSAYSSSQVSSMPQHSNSYDYSSSVPVSSMGSGQTYQTGSSTATTYLAESPMGHGNIYQSESVNVVGGSFPATSSPYHSYYGTQDPQFVQPVSSQGSNYQQYTSSYTPTVTTITNSQPSVSQSYDASTYTAPPSNYDTSAYNYSNSTSYSNQSDQISSPGVSQYPYSYGQQQNYQSNDQQYSYSQEVKPQTEYNQYPTSNQNYNESNYSQNNITPGTNYPQNNITPATNYPQSNITPATNYPQNNIVPSTNIKSQSYQNELSGLLPLQPTPTSAQPPKVFPESPPIASPSIVTLPPISKGGSSVGSHSSVSSGPNSSTSSPAHVASSIPVTKKDIFETLSTDIPDENIRPVLLPKVVPVSEFQTSKDKTEAESQSPHLKDPLSDKNILEKFVIEVDKFKKVVEGLTKKSLNGPTPLDQKWKEVTDAQDKESRKLSISIARCYPLKNRVPDIMPYDSNRIEIQSLRDDYINASFINELSPTSPKFIVTQAPLPSTFTDFWLMLWEQQVEVAVCLISNAELKGHIFWPMERGQSLSYGTLSLYLQSFKECQFFNEFMLNVTHNETKISRVIIYLQFFTWPPGAVLSNPAILLQFISEVHNYHRQQRNLQRPIVVHCLSGVGRSGIFCLLSSSMKELSLGGVIPDLSLMAIKANQQRKFLIQEKDQLKFSYEAALYYAQDLLVKRGILSNKTTFDEKIPKVRTHTRHPSEDFILGGIKIEKSSSLDSESKTSSKTDLDADSKDTAAPATEETNTITKSVESSMNEMSLTDNKDILSTPTPEPRPSSCPVNRTEESAVSIKNTSRRSSIASQASSVTSILDPANFTLDSGGQGKKKFTRDSFKNPLGLNQPTMGGSDPLSLLDPLWSIKKE